MNFKECDICKLRLLPFEKPNCNWVTFKVSYGWHNLKDGNKLTYHICNDCLVKRLPELKKAKNES